jgi:hypothetical protein
MLQRWPSFALVGHAKIQPCSPEARRCVYDIETGAREEHLSEHHSSSCYERNAAEINAENGSEDERVVHVRKSFKKCEEDKTNCSVKRNQWCKDKVEQLTIAARAPPRQACTLI